MVPSVNRSRHQSRHRRSRLVDVDKIHKTLKKVQASWHGKMMRRVNYVWNLGTYLALPVDPYPSVVHGKGMARRLTKFKRPFFRCSGSMAQSASSQRPRGSTSSRTFPFWLSEKPVLGWWCWQWILPYLTYSICFLKLTCHLARFFRHRSNLKERITKECWFYFQKLEWRIRGLWKSNLANFGNPPWI